MGANERCDVTEDELNVAVLNPSSSHINHDLTVVYVRSYLAGDGCKGKV